MVIVSTSLEYLISPRHACPKHPTLLFRIVIAYNITVYPTRYEVLLGPRVLTYFNFNLNMIK